MSALLVGHVVLDPLARWGKATPVVVKGVDRQTPAFDVLSRAARLQQVVAVPEERFSELRFRNREVPAFRGTSMARQHVRRLSPHRNAFLPDLPVWFGGARGPLVSASFLRAGIGFWNGHPNLVGEGLHDPDKIFSLRCAPTSV